LRNPPDFFQGQKTEILQGRVWGGLLELLRYFSETRQRRLGIIGMYVALVLLDNAYISFWAGVGLCFYGSKSDNF